MTKANDTRKRLIAEGRHALLTQGYDGVGIGGILAAVGVPKGSFYHFFASKDDFVCAVLDDYAAEWLAFRARIFGDPALPPLARIERWFDELEAHHATEAPLGGCLYGVLAQTAAARTPAVRERLALVFARWTAQLADLIAAAQGEGTCDPALDAEATAAFVIDAYEGALVRMKADNSMAPFLRFRAVASQYLNRTYAAAQPS